MVYFLEILNRFAPKKSCNALLYTPINADLACRETRRYAFIYEGDAKALKQFAHRVLADDVSDDTAEGDAAMIPDFQYHIDYSLKPGCLDLEKDYILKFYHELENPGFEITGLTVTRRVYLIGDDPVPSERFVKDIVNPVIHTWKVCHA